MWETLKRWKDPRVMAQDFGDLAKAYGETSQMLDSCAKRVNAAFGK